jgi:hypothetical protein
MGAIRATTGHNFDTCKNMAPLRRKLALSIKAKIIITTSFDDIDRNAATLKALLRRIHEGVDRQGLLT